MTNSMYLIKDRTGKSFDMLNLPEGEVFEGDLDLSILPEDFAKKVKWPEKFTVNGSFKVGDKEKSIQSVRSLPRDLTVMYNLDIRGARNLRRLNYADVRGIIIVSDTEPYIPLRSVDARIPDEKLRSYDPDSREYVALHPSTVKKFSSLSLSELLLAREEERTRNL